MPQIIVQAAPGERPGPVTLHERVNGNDLNSDHFARQLVERIGWALLDAEDLEETADHLGRGRGEADHAFHGEAGAPLHGPEPG